MNADEWMQQMLKEERAQNFVRSLEIVRIRPDAEFEAVIGAAFAKGTTREVHTVNGEDGVVLKMAYPRAIAANWYEYMVWSEARDTRWAGVLGKVHSISESGKYLKM